MYGQGLDVIAQLAPRSVDTLTTLLQVQGQLDHTGLSGAGGACVLPACNLQKMPNGGMNGLVLQLPETVPVMHLETLTNNVFDGVCMVRCANPSQIEERLKASGARLHTKLQLFNARERDLRHAQPSLEQVLPQDRGNDDFWWHGLNACTAISECGALSLAGGESAAHHMYYDMYTLTQNGAEASVHDVSARDGAEWRATLTGYVALVQQNTGAGAGFFLACRSSLPVFGGALVGSYRSDVGAHMSVGDFAESKEVWFLRHANNRNRRRLLAMAAAALDLTIETCVDNLASDPANAPKLAVNCAETLFEDLQHGDLHDALANECAPLGSAPRTNAHVRVVRHFIGCVDAGRARGPVLFDMGARQGLAAFMPLEAQHLALESATGLTFPMLQTAALALLPVVNVHEKTRNDAEFAHNIVRELPSMEPHDVLYGAQHTSTQLPASVCALCEGPRAMYAKRYPQHLGTVLYPAQPCVMLSETASACRNTGELPQFLITALENRRFTSTPTQTLLQHMAFSVKNKVEDKAEDTTADAEPVCLEVDTTLLETALYLAAPSHPLVPLLLFKPLAA